MKTMNEINDVQRKSWSKQKLFLLLVSLSILSIALIYQPLPDNFPQPWKYRVLSFWAHIFSKLVKHEFLLGDLSCFSSFLGLYWWTSQSLRSYSCPTVSLLCRCRMLSNTQSRTSFKSITNSIIKKQQFDCLSRSTIEKFSMSVFASSNRKNYPMSITCQQSFIFTAVDFFSVVVILTIKWPMLSPI